MLVLAHAFPLPPTIQGFVVSLQNVVRYRK
jgi:hypothetical protein